jgi:hypothetical protein
LVVLVPVRIGPTRLSYSSSLLVFPTRLPYSSFTARSGSVDEWSSG